MRPRSDAHNTLTGCQGKRPTVYSLERGLAKLKVPLHMVSGDEDDNCLEPGVFIKRVCPSAILTVVAGTGHAVNLEEPDLFNRLTAEFLAQVAAARCALARQIDDGEEGVRRKA